MNTPTLDHTEYDDAEDTGTSNTFILETIEQQYKAEIFKANQQAGSRVHPTTIALNMTGNSHRC